MSASKRFTAVVLASLMVLLLVSAACSQSASTPAPNPSSQSKVGATSQTQAAPKEVITWKMNAPTGSFMTTMFFQPNGPFKNMVEAWTGGRLKIEPVIELYPAGEAPYAVADGRIQMGHIMTSEISGDWPLFSFGLLPFIANSFEEYNAVMEMPEVDSIWKKAFLEKNLVHLMHADPPPQALWTKKPIKTVDDFKGIKFRTKGTPTLSALQKLGGSGINISYAEMQAAFQQGIVDGIVTAAYWGAVNNWVKMGATYATEFPLAITANADVVVNKQAWDKLPSDIQQGLIGLSMEMKSIRLFLNNQMMTIAGQMIKSQGGTYSAADPKEVAKAQELTKSVLTEWTSLPNNQRGNELLSTYMAARDKYRAGKTPTK